MTLSDFPGDAAPEVFRQRRELIRSLLSGGVMLLPSAPTFYRSRDTQYRYRPDNELYYSTGVTEPGALALIRGNKDPHFVLFVTGPNESTELWTGPMIGTEIAKDRFGADECYMMSELPDLLPGLIEGADCIHYRARVNDGLEFYVKQALENARSKGARRGSGPRAVVDPGGILDELRLKKEDCEIEWLRMAAQVTVAGHRAAAAIISPGVGEWTVEATLEQAFRSSAGSTVAFPTIVGSGSNGCVLHYTANDKLIDQDDLVLVDAGAEVGFYNGDVTRTYPANGYFTPAQRDVYEVVLASLESAIHKVRPGEPVTALHDAVTRVIVEGLRDLRVLRGSVDGLLEKKAYQPYYPHQTSHWLGLDVHDPGDYASAGTARVLEPGMVFTIEPGLYFRPAIAESVAENLSGIAIRIEDDVLVTEDGCEILSCGLPTSTAEIEELVGLSK